MSTSSNTSRGGAYERRGAFFIRITVAPQKRVAEHAKLARSLDEATEQARVVQSLVNRLRDAGKPDFVARLVEIGASADAAKLAELGRFVDGVVGGAIVKKTTDPAAAVSIAEQARAWRKAIASLYDETTVRTLAIYAAGWERFFGRDLNTVDAPALARYMARRLGEVTRNTVKKELWGLSNFLRWCHETGAIANVPAFPKLPKRATGVRTGRQRAKAVELSRDDVARLLGALSDRARDRYAFMAETGLRPKTIDLLSVPEHYEPGAGVLNITAEIDKNRYARTVPLSPGARALLEKVAPKSGAIFGGLRHIKDFKAAVAACALPKETAPYDLRHGLATHALRASGANLEGVAYLLGHKQVTTTNRYVHASQGAASDVLAAMHGGNGGEGSPASASDPQNARDIPRKSAHLAPSGSSARKGVRVQVPSFAQES